MQKLYQQAVAEGGTLTVYAGGSKPGQDDFLKDAFVQQFPKMKVNIVVDYSSHHDARIDNQIDEHHVVADVVHVQTFDDFMRWKEEGVPEKYKPVGWDTVYNQVKDKDGYYTGPFLRTSSSSPIPTTTTPSSTTSSSSPTSTTSATSRSCWPRTPPSSATPAT